MNNLDNEQADFETWLEIVRDLDDEIFDLLSEPASDVIKQIGGSEIEETLMVMFNLLMNMGFIKNGVYDACESDNLYSAKILYRSFMEHWLKAQYIFVRFQKEKNNDVGKEFRLYCSLDETVKYGNSIKELHRVLGLEQSGGDPWDIIFEYKPELLDKETRQSIKQKVRQFNYREIVSYLIDQTDLNDSGFLNPVIPEYSELSSYVHGGPQATADQIAETSKRFKSYQGMVRFVFNIYKIVAMSTYACVASCCDRDLITVVAGIQKIELKD